MQNNYVFKHLGWMDLLSSVPFQTLRMDTGDLKAMQLIRFLQFVRILKVFRAVKALQTAFFKLMNDTFGSLSVSVSVYSLRMAKLLTLLMIIGHVCACIWYSERHRRSPLAQPVVQ